MLTHTRTLTLDGTDQVLVTANSARHRWMAWTLSSSATISLTGAGDADAVVMPPSFSLMDMRGQNEVTINGTSGTVVYVIEEI